MSFSASVPFEKILETARIALSRAAVRRQDGEESAALDVDDDRGAARDFVARGKAFADVVLFTLSPAHAKHQLASRRDRGREDLDANAIGNL